MKAAVLYANRDMRYADFDEPEVSPGQVKVRVRAAGICGSDIPRVLHGGAHFYPVVLGHEFAGDVVETGQGVTTISAGDRVSGAPLVPCLACGDCQRGDYSLCKHYSFIGSRRQGGFADYVVMPERNAVKYDPAIPYEQAAMFEPSTVALHGLFCNGFRGGGSVAVLGGGTIGLFAMQWAKAFGADRVAVADIDEQRLELAKKLGADDAVDASSPDFIKRAMGITGGAGFDYVFETAGSAETMRAAFALAANRARLCFIGTPHAEIAFTPGLWENMNRKEFTLTGSWMSYSAPFPGREWELTASFLKTGKIRIDPDMIFRRFPMQEAAGAFSLFDTPAAVKGKIILLND